MHRSWRKNCIRRSRISWHGNPQNLRYSLVKELKAKGYHVYYLSNFSHKAETECAEALNFLPEMEGGILSYKDQLIKPEPEIYQLLLKRYGLKADEAFSWMIRW